MASHESAAVRANEGPRGRHLTSSAADSSSRPKPLIVAITIFAAALLLLTSGPAPQRLDGREPAEVAPFTPGSVWNQPLRPDAPIDPRSPQIIEFLRATNARSGCVLLAGAGGDPWGAPVYWVEEGDPSYRVSSDRYPLPSEFESLRIPVGARPGRNSDREMVLYDVDRGYVAHLSKARFSESDQRWSAGGGSVAYLDSNGLDARLPEADDPRNSGTFRGYNGLVAVIRRDEVAEQALDRALKVGVAESSEESMWPMIGSDGDSQHPDAPAQGTRIRIKADIDLRDYDLDPEAREIAETLQTHGAFIGDSTGGGMTLMLEDTRLTTGHQQWNVRRTGLCSIPITDFVVVESDGR